MLDHSRAWRPADEDFGDLLIADAQLDPADVFAMFEGRGVHVLQSERAQALAQSLVPGSGLALVLVEHRWARSLFDSIADLGDVVFSEGFIGERAEELVSVQLAALEDTARVIDAAYAAQTEAERASAAAIDAAHQKSDEAVRASAAATDAAHQKADEAAVAASVTAVEVEVLRYLPTKMTFALVADKLGILSLRRQRTRRACIQEAGCAQSRRCGRPCSRTRIDQTRGLKAASFSILHWRDGLSPAIRQPSLELNSPVRSPPGRGGRCQSLSAISASSLTSTGSAPVRRSVEHVGQQPKCALCAGRAPRRTSRPHAARLRPPHADVAGPGRPARRAEA